ncbi:MAG: DUF1887 family CARF protein [Candidatus Sumerlaeaceae bacterium]|nr:DUF1887 family CARF protein [Candidatus Sumerlaeaceae bacterium]
MSPKRSAHHLILLVGSNPLPNYIAALMLTPKTVNLIYTEETEENKERLEGLLKKKVPGIEFHETKIRDATNPTDVRDAFENFPSSEEIHLHYSGGTKVMAAHAHTAFKSKGGIDENASYLAERRGVLVFDDGDERPIADELTLDDIFTLHGITRKNKSNSGDGGSPPNYEDAQAISESVVIKKCPKSIPKQLYQMLGKNDQPSSELPFEEAKSSADQLKEQLSQILSTDETAQAIEKMLDRFMACLAKNYQQTYERWVKFFRGVWLEYYLAKAIRGLNVGTVDQGITCRRVNGREFEIDVAVVRQYRLYVVSCTTASDLPTCKQKLFEVTIRARQLGGDLARSALVCLLDGAANGQAKVDCLRRDIKDIWNSPNTPRVFAFDDIISWVKGSTESLKEWLDS